jgi:hypothetical protein
MRWPDAPTTTHGGRAAARATRGVYDHLRLGASRGGHISQVVQQAFGLRGDCRDGFRILHIEPAYRARDRLRAHQCAVTIKGGGADRRRQCVKFADRPAPQRFVDYLSRRRTTGVFSQNLADRGHVHGGQHANLEANAQGLIGIHTHQANLPVVLADVEEHALSGLIAQPPQRRVDNFALVERDLESAAQQQRFDVQPIPPVWPLAYIGHRLERDQIALQHALKEAGCLGQLPRGQTARPRRESIENSQRPFSGGDGALDRSGFIRFLQNDAHPFVKLYTIRYRVTRAGSFNLAIQDCAAILNHGDHR